ncbi:MAG TPA: CPXCG motif-containing cysteine-rich protein [Acidobacteriota bacterium]|jgi:hypothetical protein
MSTAEIECPYCGEWLEISIDPTVSSQTYVEDCQVCCRPMQVVVRFEGEEADVRAEAMD